MTMSNRYVPTKAAVVVPADAGTLVNFNRMFIGGAGNLKVDLQDGSNVTFTGIPAGFLLELSVSRVYATGTTCTNMVGLL